ncbi:VCBS domain-containing protein, partial [Mesorhizobium sp. M7A.F.Ca.CA.002.10.1.1]
QVYEAGLAAGSAAGDGSTVATGTFTVSDADGLDDVQSVTIGGVTVAIGSLNGSVFQGDHGTLLITGYNPATGVAAYQYTLTSPTTDVPAVTETDSFSLTVSDGTSSSAPAAIVIDIVDDVPNAVNDTNSISEDALSPVNGNVLTNDLHANNRPGADTPTSFVSWDGSTTGAHGTFVANPDGTYTYTLNNADPAVQALDAGQTLTETFNYTMKDADGDTDTATLTITINGTNDVPQVVVDQGNPAGAHDQVYEAGLAAGSAAGDGSTVATGTFTVSDADGLDDVQSVTIGGVTVAIGSLNGSAFQGDHGTLLITGYNPATGVAAYQYTLTSTTTDVPAVTETDSFSLTVSDGTSSSAPAAIVIDIVDDMPNAVNDTNSISEDALSPVNGNVLTNDLHANNQPGADTPTSFVSWDGSTTGAHGTFVANPDGTYTYTLNNADPAVQALDAGQTLTETFNYTMKDADGDTDTATLTITINGTNDVPQIVVDQGNPAGAHDQVYEAGLAAGSAAGDGSTVATGTFTVSDADGLDDVQSVTIGG